MCGRYGLNHPDPVLAEWYRASFMPEFVPRYNIAPTTNILTVRETERARGCHDALGTHPLPAHVSNYVRSAGAGISADVAGSLPPDSIAD
jgi:putative SOS response-associated peptidase YedK